MHLSGGRGGRRGAHGCSPRGELGPVRQAREAGGPESCVSATATHYGTVTEALLLGVQP
jgi:hypothetical protein